MGGRANVRVFLEDHHVEAGLRAAPGGQKPGRAAPDDREIVHAAMISAGSGTGKLCESLRAGRDQALRPRCSQRP